MLIKASRIHGIGLAALTTFAIAACSSDDSGTPGNTAGTGPVAGTSAGGSGGTAGTSTGGSGTTAGTSTGGSGVGGTAGTSTGGSGGSGGGGMGPFTCKGTKPTSSLIADFEMTAPNATSAGQFTWTTGLPGGTYTYPAVITTDVSGKAFNAKGMVGNYSGFGIYFNDCIDAGTAGTTGVSFKVTATGLGTNTTIEFRVQTNSTQPIDATNMKGACPGTGYPDCIDNAKTAIPVTATESEVTVLWADLMGGMKGTAPAAFDPKEISGMQWVLPWVEGADYAADVKIDDVKFVGGTFSGGGGGGAGGGGAGGGGAGGGGGGGAGGGGNGGNGGTN